MRRFLLILTSAALAAAAGLSGPLPPPSWGFDKGVPDDPALRIEAPLLRGSPESQKLDPLLREVVRRNRSRSEDPARALRRLSSLMNVRRDASGETRVSVLIRSGNPAETASGIRALGGTVRTVAGDVIVASFPPGELEALAGREEVIAVEAGVVRHPRLDQSRCDVRGDMVQAGRGLQTRLTGAGVVAAVLDTGIDWKHDDFKNPDGTTRIQFLWDMTDTVSPNPPAGYTYGTEYTAAHIDAGECNQVDWNGHGTHVTGITAGNGAIAPEYRGMAPDADIYFVNAYLDIGFPEDWIVDGCEYMLDKAAQHGRPAVVNLSLGGHFGPHDGTSNFERGLTNLGGEGRIIVAAAGNEGDFPVHLGYETRPGTDYFDALESAFYSYTETGAAVIDLWYDSGDISVGIAVYDALGRLLGYTDPVPPGASISEVPVPSLAPKGIITIDAETVSDPNNGAHRIVVVVDSQEGTFDTGSVFWSLFTFGTGEFDAWIEAGLFLEFEGEWRRVGDTSSTVGLPATAPGVLCIGSYVTKNRWVDIDGREQIRYGPLGGPAEIGMISSFSSHGPTRDGRRKPDLCAPGEAIVSALSSDREYISRRLVVRTGRHRVAQGTSMASPHAAGVIALLLEADPTLDSDDALTLLTTSARTDARTGDEPDNVYGTGKLDALDAALQVGIAPSDLARRDLLLAPSFPNPTSGSTTLAYRVPGDPGTPVPTEITVYDLSGRLLATLVDGPLVPGEYQISWDGVDTNGRRATAGVYFYRIEVGGREQSRKFVLLR